jgi:hypothetical protein
MRHGINCAHRPTRRAGRAGCLRRAPGHNNTSNDGTHGGRRRNRRARLLRPGVLAAAVAGITVVAAACGGSTPTTTAHQTVYQKELAYAQCMRGHGDPGFPDPQSNGTFNSTKANSGAFGGPPFLSANKACAHLEGPGPSPAQFRQDATVALKFVACMRAHGIVNYPEPGIDWRTHMIRIGFSPASGIDPNSPQFKSAQKACPLPRPGQGGGGS